MSSQSAETTAPAGTSPEAGRAERRLDELVARRPAPAVEALRRAWDMARDTLPAGALADDVLPDCLAVAGILNTLNLDHETLAAAILHGRVGPEAVRRNLGEGVARLLEGVGRMDQIRELHEPEAELEQSRLEGLRKLLLAMAEDLRVVLITLAERLQLLRNLHRLPESARPPVARETLDIYAPLANRLGIWQIKWELEDLAFRYLEPDRYQRLARSLDERREDRERYVAGVVARLEGALAKEGIEAEVSGRSKHLFSIWRKMQRKHLDFTEVFDVRAVRVIVPSVRDCYAALGVVHGLWQHIPREFDDYIANPKGNNYRSLHTAVIGPAGRTLEVQIRTREMHEHAELGVAAHWRYKEGGARDPGLDDRIAWLRQMLELREESADGADFLDRFKTEVFHDRVYVLTPRGRVIDLPRGATPLDFAYTVHSELGHRCRGAKVAGSIVPLTYELKNGDQVEILSTRQGAPSRDWLNPNLGYLKTARARGKVRQWFKQQDLDKNIAAGREQLDRELKRLGVSEVGLEKLAGRLKFAKVDDLLAALGRGEVGPSQIAGAVQEEAMPPAPPREPRPRRATEADGGVVIDGVGNLMTHLARCCRPAPPEPITGYITLGRGVTIHRQDCPNALRMASRDPSRFIDVSWSSARDRTYPVEVQIEAYDRQGLLRDISALLANERVNVLGVNTLTDRDTRMAQMRLTLEVRDVVQLSRILGRLSRLPNVVDVRRRKEGA